MAAVHKPPAISAIDNPDVLRVAKAGVLKDISADVAKIQLWNDMYPGPKAAVTDGSKVYGVPIGSNSLALYYNKKLLTDAGVSAPPQTWDQLTETAAKTTKSPVYGIAFSAVNTEEATWQWEPFLWSNGGSLSDLSSKNAQAALELWVDWVKKGYASSDVVNWNQGDVPNQFISGRAATMVMGPWQLGEVKKSGIDFGIVTIPVPKEGAKAGCSARRRGLVRSEGRPQSRTSRAQVHSNSRRNRSVCARSATRSTTFRRSAASPSSRAKLIPSCSPSWIKWPPLGPGRKTVERSTRRSLWRLARRFSARSRVRLASKRR